MAWCTAAQISLAMNTNEITDYADDDRDGSADTNVVTEAADRAAHDIWSYIGDRYNSTTAMRPESYTAGSGTYPMLESKNAILAADYLRWRQGRGSPINEDHPVIQWSMRVRHYLADVQST